MTETRPITSIQVGERRRKNLGDIHALAVSIADVGLLRPIVITADGTVIAGARRLAAANHLGLNEIPVTVVDIDDIMRGEAVENFSRKDFTASEAVAIKRMLKPKFRAAAKERMRAGKPSEKFSKGRAADKAAAFAGYSRPTLCKAEATSSWRAQAGEVRPARCRDGLYGQS